MGCLITMAQLEFVLTFNYHVIRYHKETAILTDVKPFRNVKTKLFEAAAGSLPPSYSGNDPLSVQLMVIDSRKWPR